MVVSGEWWSIHSSVNTCVFTQGWSSVVNSLGTTSGLQVFLDKVTSEYVRVANQVLQGNAHKTAVALKEKIDSLQYKVDLTTPQLFVDCWNNVAGESFRITVEEARIEDSMYKWKYFWCLGPLLQVCRQAFAKSVRRTFDVKMTPKPYVPDKEDDHHTYYTTGVVWRSLFKHYQRTGDTRVTNIIKLMFVSPKQAKALKLPSQEVAVK